MTEAVRRDSQVKELFCIDIKAISISTVENRVCWTWGYSWQYPLLCLHAALRKGNNNTNKTLFIHSLTLTLKKSSWCTTQQLGKVLINLFVRVVLPPLVTLKQKVIKMHINVAFQLFWSEKKQLCKLSSRQYCYNIFRLLLFVNLVHMTKKSHICL